MHARIGLFCQAVLFPMLGAGIAFADLGDGPRTGVVFPHTLPGRKFEVWKKWDPATHTFVFASNSELIRSGSDLARLEEAERQARAGKWGAFSGALADEFEKMDSAGTMEILVSMKFPEGVAYFDKTKVPLRMQQEQSLQVAGVQPVADPVSFFSNRGFKGHSRSGKASAIVRARKSDLVKIMFLPEIATIEKYIPSTPAQSGIPAWATLATSAYSHGPTAIPTNAAAGVNAATIEYGGLPQPYVTCIGIPVGEQYRISIGTIYNEHAMGVFRHLQYAAPGAKLWQRNAESYYGPGTEDWIVNNGIQSLSHSVLWWGGPDDTQNFRTLDDFAYRWPYPVFSNPTGNLGYGFTSAWQCYNGMSVGNVRHSNQNHWELVDVGNANSGCTQTTNPYPDYGTTCIAGGGATCIGDREMPYLVAPGHPPSGIQLTDPCGSFFPGELAGCGTSWSAPVANGMAADVISSDGRMVGWPEKVRAVLLATAQNVHGGDWTTTIDGKDGAGVIHGSGAVTLAKTHTQVYPNGAGAAYGVGAASLYAADFNSPNNPIVYKVLIPNPKPAGKHLRVVLTWDSNPVLNANVNALSDLDLLVTSGSAGKVSQSNNGNVEIVDIPNTMFTPGATVDARVSKWMNRIPSGARTNFFYYAIAWNWVKDHAD